eukprot:8308066-Pyramimonas_sp.AAC.1
MPELGGWSVGGPTLGGLSPWGLRGDKSVRRAELALGRLKHNTLRRPKVNHRTATKRAAVAAVAPA